MLQLKLIQLSNCQILLVGFAFVKASFGRAVKSSNSPIVKSSDCQLSLAKNLSSASSIANLGIGNPASAASSMGRV